MKKIILTTLLGVVLVVSLSGCNKSVAKKLNSNDDMHSFKGTIIECEQKNDY